MLTRCVACVLALKGYTNKFKMVPRSKKRPVRTKCKAWLMRSDRFASFGMKFSRARGAGPVMGVPEGMVLAASARLVVGGVAGRTMGALVPCFAICWACCKKGFLLPDEEMLMALV